MKTSKKITHKKRKYKRSLRKTKIIAMRRSVRRICHEIVYGDSSALKCITAQIYFFRAYDNVYKLGFSKNALGRFYKFVEKRYPDAELLHIWETPIALQKEAAMHRVLKHRQHIMPDARLTEYYTFDETEVRRILWLMSDEICPEVRHLVCGLRAFISRAQS